MPNTQAFVEALATLGLNVLPYAKYVALAWVVWTVFIGVVVIAVFSFIIFQFFEMSRNFR